MVSGRSRRRGHTKATTARGARAATRLSNGMLLLPKRVRLSGLPKHRVAGYLGLVGDLAPTLGGSCWLTSSAIR